VTFEGFISPPTGFTIRCLNLLEGLDDVADILAREHHALDDASDVEEAYPPGEERLDSHLVCRIQNDRSKTAQRQRLPRQT
jgi:hypothetical protein